jgi:hypothetical protein
LDCPPWFAFGFGFEPPGTVKVKNEGGIAEEVEHRSGIDREVGRHDGAGCGVDGRPDGCPEGEATLYQGSGFVTDTADGFGGERQPMGTRDKTVRVYARVRKMAHETIEHAVESPARLGSEPTLSELDGVQNSRNGGNHHISGERSSGYVENIGWVRRKQPKQRVRWTKGDSRALLGGWKFFSRSTVRITCR